MSSGAILIRRQDHLMRAFAKAGAVTPHTAKTLDQIGVRSSWFFQHLVISGVIHSEGDAWWMDEEAAATFRRRRKTRIIIMITLVVIAVLAAILI